MTAPKFLAGVDVGSTTVKAILLDAQCDEIVWKDYRRHETRQVETLLDFLCRMEAGIGISPDNCRVFMTGSGGNMLADLVGAKYVQEVLAASLTVEQNCAEATSFVEIGGQDAKALKIGQGRLINFVMNDKCAAGTGRFLEVMARALEVDLEELGPLSRQSTTAVAMLSLTTSRRVTGSWILSLTMRS